MRPPKKDRKNAGGRPQSNSAPVGNNRTLDADNDTDERSARLNRDYATWYARLDPMNESQMLVMLLFQSLVPAFPLKSNDHIRDLGRFFDNILRGKPDYAERVFKRIVKLMRNRENPDRRAYALMAYANYFREVGKEPSKAKLKAYMIARREIYKEKPSDDDGKGWTRLWEDCGLFSLPNGVGAKARNPS